MSPARRSTIATMRASAGQAHGTPVAAGFLHLADLLQHHERGFPNVVARREVELKDEIRFAAPRKLTRNMESALGRVAS